MSLGALQAGLSELSHGGMELVSAECFACQQSALREVGHPICLTLAEHHDHDQHGHEAEDLQKLCDAHPELWRHRCFVSKTPEG